MLSCLIFDALNTPRFKGDWSVITDEMDENHGFDAAVAALGLKAYVGEADHPLLFEGTRRQRGDSVITLLVYHEDEPTKLAKIMEKLLDREVYQLIKSPIVSSYYRSNPPTISQMAGVKRAKACSSPLTSSETTMNGKGIAGTSSRPYSNISAELGTGINASTVQPKPTQALVSTRTKQTRLGRQEYKSKKVYSSIPNQS